MERKLKGMVMYENDKDIVVNLHINGDKTTAYMYFCGLQIDLSSVAQQAISFPMSFDKMHQLMGKKIIDALEEAKNNHKYSAVFTRIDNGSGRIVLRNRMTQIVSFIYYRWYTDEQRKESERKHEYKSFYSNLDWRIGGQNYYIGD
jgi:hypothetical protein